MKKAIVIVLALSLVLAGVAMATVVSSKHDMRETVTSVNGRTMVSLGSTTSQVCVFCHHPHRGDGGNVSSILLWNINDSNNTYATYTSPTMNSTGGQDMTAVSTSARASQYTLLCMGCHDGGGTSNNFIRSTSGASLGNVPAVTGQANLGTSLSDDHPVDFTYPTAGQSLPDIQLQSNGKVNGEYPLFDGTMQCATCHAVHNAGTQQIQFMRGTLADSSICIDCHTAK